MAALSVERVSGFGSNTELQIAIGFALDSCYCITALVGSAAQQEIKVKVKVKLSLYRPIQALRFQEVEDPRL